MKCLCYADDNCFFFVLSLCNERECKMNVFFKIGILCNANDAIMQWCNDAMIPFFCVFAERGYLQVVIWKFPHYMPPHIGEKEKHIFFDFQKFWRKNWLNWMQRCNTQFGKPLWPKRGETYDRSMNRQNPSNCIWFNPGSVDIPSFPTPSIFNFPISFIL